MLAHFRTEDARYYVKSLSYLKKNADDSNRSSFVETSYLNTDMCKFETTQK